MLELRPGCPGRGLCHKSQIPLWLTKKERKGRGWGQWGEMNQSLYAHMNNKRKMKEKKKRKGTHWMGIR
jgi:hypothetical protein